MKPRSWQPASVGHICISREVMVLDESASRIDDSTEAEFALALRRIGEGRSLIVIAHRRLPWQTKCWSYGMGASSLLRSGLLEIAVLDLSAPR